MFPVHFANQVPRNLEKLIANPVKANDNSWANPTEIHAATWRIKHVCQKYIFVLCCWLLWNSQFYMFPWRFLAHSTSHAPINVLENDTKHIKSLELFQNRNIFVRNMLVLLCWFSVVCVCSLQVSCTIWSACSQESWEVDCQSCQSTWKFMSQSYRNTCSYLKDWTCVPEIYICVVLFCWCEIHNSTFFLQVSCTLHKSCLHKCFGAWHNTHQVIKVIAEPQHMCGKYVSFALLVCCRMCLFPAGFLHILLIMFQGFLKGCSPILWKHLIIHEPILQKCMQLFGRLNMCVRNIYLFSSFLLPPASFLLPLSPSLLLAPSWSFLLWQALVLYHLWPHCCRQLVLHLHFLQFCRIIICYCLGLRPFRLDCEGSHLSLSLFCWDHGQQFLQSCYAGWCPRSPMAHSGGLCKFCANFKNGAAEICRSHCVHLQDSMPGDEEACWQQVVAMH